LLDRKQLWHSENNFADMILTCPPYWNIEKYESCNGQLSDEKSYDSFLKKHNVALLEDSTLLLLVFSLKIRFINILDVPIV
jgi:hypothetical protein